MARFKEGPQGAMVGGGEDGLMRSRLEIRRLAKKTIICSCPLNLGNLLWPMKSEHVILGQRLKSQFLLCDTFFSFDESTPSS